VTALPRSSDVDLLGDGERTIDLDAEVSDRALHSLIDAMLKSLPLYDYLFLLMDVARDVTEAASFAIRGDNLELNEIEEEARREATFFGHRLSKLLPQAAINPAAPRARPGREQLER
jgi:hypothetical protein